MDHPTREAFVKNLVEASQITSSAVDRELFLLAAEIIESQHEALKPFMKEANAYSGWHPQTIITVDDGDGDTREAWYTIADLRRAREEWDLWTRKPSQHRPTLSQGSQP